MASSEQAPGPQVGMLWFFIVTTLYIPVKYMGFSVEKGGTSSAYFTAYVLLVIVGEYVINLMATSAMCGAPQWGTTVAVTVLPWALIFGSLNLLLMIFPGWLSPFSNTIGYAVAKALGAEGVLTDMLQQDGNSPLDSDTQRTLARIFSDKALMINEIPGSIDGFVGFWKRLSPLMNREAGPSGSSKEVIGMLKGAPPNADGTPTPKTLARRLFDLVRIKNLVSEYVWFLLTGGLVTSVAYNYIVSSSCELSAEDMERRHNEYMEKEAAAAKKKAAEPDRVYTSTD